MKEKKTMKGSIKGQFILLAIFLYGFMGYSHSFSAGPAELFGEYTPLNAEAAYQASSVGGERRLVKGEERIRPITIRGDLLAQRIEKGQEKISGKTGWLKRTGPISFNFFDDVTFNVVCDKLKSKSTNGFEWLGHVEGWSIAA